MWFITKIKINAIVEVPASIPQSLLTSIAGDASVAIQSPQLQQPQPLLPQLTGKSLNTKPLNAGQSGISPVQQNNALNAYIQDLLDVDRIQYGSYFDSFNPAQGVLSGAECFPVFSKSNLPSAELAQIWELVAIERGAGIGKESFVAAMHLIKKRISGAAIPTNTTQVVIGAVQPQVPVGAAQAPPLLDLNTIIPSTSTAAKPKPDPTFSIPMTYTAPPSTGSTYTPPVFATTGSSMLSLEAKELVLREQALATRTQELKQLTDQLLELNPTAQELKKKRSVLDDEYKVVNEKKSLVTIELAQVRSEYEMEREMMKEREEMLGRDRHSLQVAQMELQQYKDALAGLKSENASSGEKMQTQKSELALMKKSVFDLGQEINKWRELTQKVFGESKTQQVLYDSTFKQLEGGKEEHRIVKQNLDLEVNRLEQDKKKVEALEQQLSVQNAIIEREKVRMGEMERESKEQALKSQDLVASMDNLAVQESGKAMSISSITRDEIVIPGADQPAPLVPSLSSKPAKGHSTGHISEELAAIVETIPVSTMSPTNRPTSSASTPAALQKERDSIDLDSMFASNRPKSQGVPLVADFDFFASPAPNASIASPTVQSPTSSVFKTASLLAESISPSKPPSSFPSKFAFDGTFAAPQPLFSNSPKSVFKGFPDSEFGGFKNGPTGASDLDNAFGVVANTAPVGDPFGTVDFDGAFKGALQSPETGPVVAVAAVNSVEVQGIIDMGFTKEQAVNALEM